MKDLASANGSLIIAYDVEEGTYSSQYIPSELLEKKKENVGYDEFSNMISIGFYADEASLFFE